MRLRGSLTEEYAREELSALHRVFSSHPQFEHFVRIARECVPGAASVRAFSWFPDEEDDMVTLLVDDTHLIRMLVPPETGVEPELFSVATTSRGLKRQDQIRLAVAVNFIPETKL